MDDTALKYRSRRRLLMGVSILALNIAPGVLEPTMACLSVSTNTTVSGSTACIDWSGGNLSLTNTGVLNTPFVALSASGNLSTQTLTNSGRILAGMGLSNTGTIGAVANEVTGTISTGSSAAVVNGGTIGTLSNSGLITSAVSALSNYGRISTLANSGTITSMEAILNSGSGQIDTLANSGTISGALYGIGNFGSIGTLTNSGTIRGTGNAIYIGSSATLGPIVNSGLISGNITNLAAPNLTIDGGSGLTFGTLTGSSGGIGAADEGVITSQSSNVVLAAGNILLNDAIDVGSHTVVNSGATVELVNPVSITGAYQQTGGGLVSEAASTTSYGYLAVSGNATVANSSIVITGSGLAAGDSFTIVRSGATGSYTSDTASVIGTGGLTATVQAVNETLVVSLAVPPTTTGSSSGPSESGVFAARGRVEGGIAAPLGAVLDRINGSGSPVGLAFQESVLTPLALLPASQQGPAIKELAPVPSAALFPMVSTSVSSVLATVQNRQSAMMAYNPQTGEAAGSGTLNNTLWSQMLGGGAMSNSTPEANGYRVNDFGMTVGFDHLFTPNALGGVAFSWLRSWSRGTASPSAQSATMDSYQLTLYGTYRYGRAFVDGQLGTGWNSFAQNRPIDFLGETASAQYDGRQYLGYALAGYDIPVGWPGRMILTPLAGLRWLRANNASYTESGAGSADVSVAGQTIDSVTQELGGKASWSFATRFGTISPEVKAEWVHDYTGGAIPTSSVIGGQAFAVTTPGIAADGARIAVATTLARSDSLSFRAEYDGDLRSGYQSQTGLLQALWRF